MAERRSAFEILVEALLDTEPGEIPKIDTFESPMTFSFEIMPDYIEGPWRFTFN